MSEPLNNRVGARRRALGLSQTDLASRAGISRQALSAIENGQTAPGGPLMLALARALAQPVEALFWLGEADGRVVSARWGGACSAAGTPAAVAMLGERVVLGWVRGRWVAHPVRDVRIPAAGTVAEVHEARVDVAVFDGDVARWRDGHLLAIGCDPAMALLGAHVTQRAPARRVTWLDAPSGASLDAVADGLAHVAGIHLHDRSAQAFNVPFVAARLRDALVVNLAGWTQGLAVATGDPLAIADADPLGARLAAPDVRVVQRPDGAGAQRLLEHVLGDAVLDARAIVARSHRSVAESIAMGTADAGIVPRGVAEAYGLHFVPLEAERFDLVVPGDAVAHPAVRQLLECAASPAFRRELDALGGYETPDTGRVLATIGNAAATREAS